MNDPIIIIGAGLSGLRAASMLISQGIACNVLDGRDRIGGRVLSVEATNRPDLGKFDLGPTWFWPEREPMISRLVMELGLETVEQYTKGAILFEPSKNEQIQRHILPEGAVERSVRLAGGIGSLVDKIAATLPNGVVQLEKIVKTIRMDNEGKIMIEVDLADGKQESIHASAVILALPPRIIAQKILFSPPLPSVLMTSLEDKPTWMARQAKVVAIYDRPFWREDGLSGHAISRVGPLQEIHDASPETDCGAVFGFFEFTPEMRQTLGEEKIRQLVIDQLTRIFGPSAEKPISLLYKDWSNDRETAVTEDAQQLLDFPNYGLPPSAGIWERKLIFSGTETVSKHGGHLEGALQSAEHAVLEILALYK